MESHFIKLKQYTKIFTLIIRYKIAIKQIWRIDTEPLWNGRECPQKTLRTYTGLDLPEGKVKHLASIQTFHVPQESFQLSKKSSYFFPAPLTLRNTEETLLQSFLEILKRPLQNCYKIVYKCFFDVVISRIKSITTRRCVTRRDRINHLDTFYSFSTDNLMSIRIYI